MRHVIVRKAPLQSPNEREDLKNKSPQELIVMMWRLALDAWSFKERTNVEPRLQRHVVVLKNLKD
jgi:hypothetical protein